MNFWYDTEANKFLADLITTDETLSVKNVKKEFGYNQFLGTDNEQKIVSVLDCGTDSIKSYDEVDTSLSAKNQTKSPETHSDSLAIPIFTITLGLGTILLTARRKKNVG